MDPQKTSDGKPFGPYRYKEIVKERFLISKNMNTSYNEIGQITPLEREYLMQFIAEEIEARNKEMEKYKKQRTKN